jgi:hypothetical protein
MSEGATQPDLQQKYNQFIDLLPLTMALAGLPPSGHRLFNEEQVDARAMTFKAAFRVAKTLAKELSDQNFVKLLPLTICLAGLPMSEQRLFTEEQIEARAITVRAAYRVARATTRDCLGGS